MADLSANMKGMSLGDSQHAPNGEGRSAYIPPHARSSGGPRGPPGPAAFDGAPPANGSWNGPTPAAA